MTMTSSQNNGIIHSITLSLCQNYQMAHRAHMLMIQYHPLYPVLCDLPIALYGCLETCDCEIMFVPEYNTQNILYLFGMSPTVCGMYVCMTKHSI